jgi:hypothetical protein
MSTELKLITPRRNFLIRALGFTAAGATLPIGLVAADDPAARIAHYQAELEKAWREHYGPATVRTYADVRLAGATYASHGRQWAALSSFMICSSEDKKADWAVEGHAWKCQPPSSI